MERTEADRERFRERHPKLHELDLLDDVMLAIDTHAKDWPNANPLLAAFIQSPETGNRYRWNRDTKLWEILE